MRILPNLLTERIESLKAGTIGALAFAIPQTTVVLFHTSFIVPRWQLLASLQVSSSFELLLLTIIGGASGFLFGITYRYIIRADSNPHLKDGAVLAFGLVRGLATIESMTSRDRLWISLVLGLLSIIYFAIARSALDWAMSRKLLQPFS